MLSPSSNWTNGVAQHHAQRMLVSRPLPPYPPRPVSASSLAELQKRLRAFAQEREWERFHCPKNLAMALAAEAGELLEPFLWISEDDSRNLTDEQKHAVTEEMADVMIYLARLADILDVDLLEAARAKLAQNAAKYPVEKARGNALKYTAWNKKQDDK